jgi:hypothetical protein
MNIKNHSRVVNSTDPDFSIETYFKQNEVEILALERLSSELDLQVVDTVDLFCIPLCQILNSNSLKPLYFDTSHLTKTGASLMISRMKESFLKRDR